MVGSLAATLGRNSAFILWLHFNVLLILDLTSAFNTFVLIEIIEHQKVADLLAAHP